MTRGEKLRELLVRLSQDMGELDAETYALVYKPRGSENPIVAGGDATTEGNGGIIALLKKAAQALNGKMS